VSRRDAAAEAIGAVNTLWFEDGRLVGGNTDAFGFAANLDETLAGWRSATRATVLGAGGAARAVLHALDVAGIREITIVNRTLARAQDLAAAFGSRFAAAEWASLPAALASTDLLINTTALGMAGEADAGIELDSMPDSAMVTDIVY